MTGRRRFSVLCCSIFLLALALLPDTGHALSMRNVQFAFDSAELDENSRYVIDAYAEFMLKDPSRYYEVIGHTCSLGSEDYNRNLSRRRAEAVKAYLVGKGLPERQILAIGVGSAQPKFDNKISVGRRLNRRVEFNWW